MIITKTPFRISFFGGGTDFPAFYKEHGGSVISTTIDKGCYTNVRHLPPFFEYKHSISYTKNEFANDVNEIQHPLVREAIKMQNMFEMSVNHDADLPARSGLGTSSSFAVGLLNAFHIMKGEYVDKYTLSKEAIYLERVLCNESGGVQDQIAASYGGFNRINFFDDDFEVCPIIITNEKRRQLVSNLQLYFTGFSRFSFKISEKHESAIPDKTKELIEMLSLVDEAEKILVSKLSNLDEFGKLLDYTWKLKRSVNSAVSTNIIDEIYEKAKNAGALGGKLLGAGGGGFLLFYVPQNKHSSVRKSLSQLLEVPFDFESSGSHVVYYAAEDYVIPND